MKTGILNLTKNEKIACCVETVLSFAPFIRELEDRLKDDDSVKARFYHYVLSKFKKEGACVGQEVTDSEELLGLIFSAVSPMIANEKTFFWGLGTPVPAEVFYGTDAFYNLLTHDQSSEKKEEFETYIDLYKRRQDTFIYKLILEKIYHFPSFLKNGAIYSYKTPDSKLEKYFEVNIDTRFIDVKIKGEVPKLDLKTIEPYLYEEKDLDFLGDLLPLNLFTFEGFSILTLEDITPEQTIENIRSAIASNGIGENELYRRVIQSLKTLVEDHDVEFGLLPFLKVNKQIAFNTEVCSNSVLIRSALQNCFDDEGFNALVNNFISNPKALFFSEITEEDQDKLFFLNILKEAGIQSYAIIPVFFNRKLAGIMEVYSRKNLIFYEKLLSRLDTAIPFIAQLLQQSINDFDAKIEAVIKEKFTSLQPAVQWKFNEVAWKYLMRQPGSQKIETVAFKNVYPLYGAVDIRNSTIERNRALQEDIRINLTILISTLKTIKQHINLNVTDEFVFKCEKWLQKISDPVTPHDEIQLNYFFEKEIKPFLSHLKGSYPSTAESITEYLNAVDEATGAAFKNRRDLEDSMQIITTAVNKYFENVQEELQSPFPCYFEKFRTDGIEYDIYIGQSIAPNRVFNYMYLKNLRLWQLKSMIEIAKLTKSLLSGMPRQLETTQLIFIHGNAIDISFRNDERRFDVEGSYNIRYEMIKKRIDKVSIKDTAERLTQPGKIALVYFDRNEVNEYLTYIQYMQEQDLLNSDLEYLDLEELQGVTGLKAIRVGVREVEG